MNKTDDHRSRRVHWKTAAGELLDQSALHASSILERAEVKELAGSNVIAAKAFAELTFCFDLVNRARELIHERVGRDWKPIDATLEDRVLDLLCQRFEETREQKGMRLDELREALPDRHEMSVWRAVKKLRKLGFVDERAKNGTGQYANPKGYCPSQLGMQKWRAGHNQPQVADSRPPAASNGTA